MADIPNAAQSVQIIDEASGTTIVPNVDNSMPVGVLNASSARINPATDRTTAAAPFAFRLSDGAAFYNALTDTQLRASAVPISGTITANQGTPVAVASAWPTKITDGTNTALVSSAGGLIIAGLSAVGAAPSNNPVSVSGVDGGGLKRALLTDATGAQVIVQATAANLNATVTGTITANAGTNLNTSALALDATLAKLTIAQGTALGANTVALMGASVTTAAPAYTTGQISPLSMDAAGNLRVTGGGVAQGSTTSGQSGALIQGAVTAASPAYTTGQTSPISLDTGGFLRVALKSGGSTGAASPTNANLVGGTDGTNLRALLTDTGGRVFTLLSDGTNTAAVKAASTAPVATDTAIVVTISPNSPDPDAGSTGAAVPSKAAYVGGIDGSGNLRGFLTDAGGRQTVLLSDGTNTAAVKAASTAAVATDTSAVVALSPNSNSVKLQDGAGNALTTDLVPGGGRALDTVVNPPVTTCYAASTNGTNTGGTTAATVTSHAYLFHGAGVAKRYEITRIVVSCIIGQANRGDCTFNLARITAENATPGGTAQTIGALDPADAGSAGTFRTGANAPTRAGGDLATQAFDANTTGQGGGASNNSTIVLFDENIFGKPLVIRSGVAEGWEVRSIVGAVITTGLKVAVTYWWREI